MTKRILVVAAALAAFALVATGAFAQVSSCSGFTGQKVQFVAAGSSAQFNVFAYAATDYANALLAENGITGTPAIWSAKNGKSGSTIFLQDTRFGTPNSSSPTDAANMWVVWAPADNGAGDCYVWVYYSIDSTVGVKDFFAYKKITSPVATSVAAVYPICLSGSSGCSASNATVFGAGQSIIPGFVDQAALPTTIQTFLTTPPSPATSTTPALPYCGQAATGKSTFYCYLNAGMTDIRPEDALYATTRALSALNSTNGLAGLGYGQSGCGAASTNQGCPIYSSVGTGSVFNVLNFKLSGTDPVTGSALPVYGTLSTGAAPIVVFVNNADTSSLGFGAKSGSNYVFTNVNRRVLAMTEEGTLHCTGDFLADPAGAGQPIQVVQREPLSGTYNTFEFTAVRTLTGSASTAVPQSKISSLTWVTADDSGQEYGNNPTTNFGTGTCVGGKTVPTSLCGDPLYLPTPVNGNANSCGAGLKIRAIGTGELVKSVIQANSGQPATPDGLGYAFWGYQNFAPLVSKANCAENTGGNTTCTSYAGHYLAVDGIDPFWPSTGVPLDGGTAYNLPQCTAVVFGNNADFPCYQIPFTHINDGSYPFWSLLRLVTFGQSGTAYKTPVGVINTVAYAEKEASTGSTQLSDFVGFLQGLTNSGTLEAPNWNGSLSLGVFRSHYKQTGGSINPDNGHYQQVGTTFSACNPASIPLVGAQKTTPVCWVDAGNDVGGAVLSVQSDLDFIADFGLNGGAKNPPNPVEIYGLHQ